MSTRSTAPSASYPVVPAVAQPAGSVLAGLEDLLDQHVGAAGQRGQVVEVRRRVAQAVGVVDPQPVDEPLVEPAPDLDVRLVEDLRLLDADAGQGVDREEAPVVQLGVGRAAS